MSDRYEIAKEFGDGFAAAVRPDAIDYDKSEHWIAGYNAGYPFRKRKNQLLNEYLVSIGKEPMAKVRLI